MHYHRTWPSLAKEGVWVAGFCGSGCKGGNQLFYLMRVREVFGNFIKLWESLLESVRTAKSSCNSIYGDIYEPKRRAQADPYDPENYREPVKNHKHQKRAWRNDICFRFPKKPAKQPALLVGDVQQSFLWQRPRYAYTGDKHPRFKFYDSLVDFCAHLTEVIK